MLNTPWIDILAGELLSICQIVRGLLWRSQGPGSLFSFAELKKNPQIERDIRCNCRQPHAVLQNLIRASMSQVAQISEPSVFIAFAMISWRTYSLQSLWFMLLTKSQWKQFWIRGCSDIVCKCTVSLSTVWRSEKEMITVKNSFFFFYLFCGRSWSWLKGCIFSWHARSTLSWHTM